MATVRSFVAVGCGLTILLMVGCGPGPKDLQIQSLTEEVNRLEGENHGLRSQLARANSERDEARGRVLDLQQQLANLQAEIAKGSLRQEGPWMERPGIAWQDIADNILFDSGKANLKSAGTGVIQQVVADIRQRYAGRQVWIIGHTDSDPIKHSKWKDNLELSVQRACTVHREMQKLGMDPDHMVAAGQGEYHPKVANAANTKHLNRRVQIIAVEVPETSRIQEPAEGG